MKLAAGLIICALFLVVPVAHADSADDQFVAALDAHHVPGDRGVLIGVAHETCDLRNLPRIAWGGMPPLASGMIKVREELLAQNVTPGAPMIDFKNAARDAYCSDLDQQIPNLA